QAEFVHLSTAVAGMLIDCDTVSGDGSAITASSEARPVRRGELAVEGKRDLLHSRHQADTDCWFMRKRDHDIAPATAQNVAHPGLPQQRGGQYPAPVSG